MLERKMYTVLKEWKNRDHKCLLITGQRQVGKTYIIEAFAKAEYDHYVRIDFSEDPDKCRLFSGSILAQDLIRNISLEYGQGSIEEGKTLLFLDEIQECPRAYASLKYFTEYGKLDVIASGLFLGVTLPGCRHPNDSLIPVGYEESAVMYAMDFEEFLWARKIPKESVEEVRSCIRDKRPIDPLLYDRFTHLFREYMIVGGMPEAVEAFAESGDFRSAGIIQKDLVSSCMRDMNHYNSGQDCIKTMECFESIPYQLADTNKKFMYSRIIGEGSRRSSDRYRENLLWIKDAGYGVFCYGLEQPALPLGKYAKKDLFKIYLSDTGVLLSRYGDKARMAVYSGDHSYNMGAVAENAVADAVIRCGYEPFYYRNDKGEGKMELDFVLEFWDGVAVIEVKSGRDKEARSLAAADKRFSIGRRIMLEEGNIEVDPSGVEHYPLFACAFIDDMDCRPEGPVFS